MIKDHLNEEGKAIPKIFAEAYFTKQKVDGVMSDSKAKINLANKAFPLMTAKLIHERDPEGEVKGWFTQIVRMMQ